MLGVSLRKFVFGNPGTTETTFLAAVAASKATYVLSLHESSAVGIAAGYALVTGKPSLSRLGQWHVQHAQRIDVWGAIARRQWSAGFALSHS
jgi:thiamine pyrophosphate-dependent enzyme